MVVILHKNATPAEVRAALAQFNIHPSADGRTRSSFGKLKRGLDGLTYQKLRREEW